MPSLPSGLHEFRGAREGYEPERKEVMIAPGQEVTVSLRIRYVRQIKKPGLALNEQGEKLLYTRRSSLSLLNLLPVERKQSEDDLRKAAALCTRMLAGSEALQVGDAAAAVDTDSDAVEAHGIQQS